MFALNQKVVYPGHGVAIINRIIKKKIAGKECAFFELLFINKDMTILAPVDSAASVGIRALCTPQHIRDLFLLLSKQAPLPVAGESVAANWNKRNKEYQGKIRTGDLKEICEIYRDLRLMERQKELSFGEKNLLHQTEALLVEEISLVSNTAEDKAVEQLRLVTSSFGIPLSTDGSMLEQQP